MGKTLDALLGRKKGFRSSKLKTLLSLTASRLALLQNKSQSRRSHAEGDIANLLRHGHRHQALSRAEYLVKERDVLDCFELVERLCNLLKERAVLLEHNKTCPAELEEAVSTLIYMATRSSELPELKDVRSIFSARFGETFVRAATEARDGCSVNPTIMQKMSTREPTHEDKMKVIKAIAAEKGIPFNLDHFPSPPENSSKAAKEELSRTGQLPDSERPPPPPPPPSWYWEEDIISGGTGKMREKFKDASSAAEAAFKSAAFAAAAARVAVDLSRGGSHDGKGGPDDQNSSASSRRPMETEENTDHTTNQTGSDKVNPAQRGTTSESQEDEDLEARITISHEEPRREAKPRPGKEIVHDSSGDDDIDTEEEILQESRGSGAENNRGGTEHDLEINTHYYDDDDSSEEEEEEAPRIWNEDSKGNITPPYQKPPSLKPEEYTLDTITEGNVGFAEGAPRRPPPPSKFADPRMKWGRQPQSPLGQNSFSVRTRRSGF